jgi:hypothetical protein
MEESLQESLQLYKEITSSFTMDEENADYLKTEIQERISSVLQTVLSKSDDDDCRGFVKGVNDCTCVCGQSIEEHISGNEPEIMELVSRWCDRIYRLSSPVRDLQRYNHITLAFHSHGCDIPIPIYELVAEMRDYLHNVIMCSAREHGCPFTGDSTNILMKLNNSYKNQGEDPVVQLSHYKQKNMQLVDQFHIHKLSVDRFYQFTKEIVNRYNIPSAGIYVLSSREGHVSFTYTDRVSMMERNNLLSEDLHPSLQWIQHILQVGPHTQETTLLFILQKLFQFDYTMKVHIIDLGCRGICDDALLPINHPYISGSRNPITLSDVKYLENRHGIKQKNKKQKNKKQKKSKRKYR